MNSKDTLHMRQCFLRMLLEGNHFFSEEKLNNWDEGLSLSLCGQCWFCVVIRPTDFDYAEDFPVKLERQCKKAISDEKLCGYAILNGAMDVLLLLPYDEKTQIETLDKLVHRISRSVKQQVQIGAGLPYEKLSQLYRSKEEAYEILGWGGKQMCIANNQTGSEDRKITVFSIQDGCRRILSKYKNGIMRDLHTDLNIVAEQVRSNTIILPDAPYPTSIRRTMIELLVEMLHIASDAGVDVDKEIGYIDPYRKIFELQGTPAIIQWVTDIAQGLSEAMNSRKKQIEINQLEQVKQYINTHISDITLSLSSVSKIVGMSPGYFSAFFIREAGLGFKEYVTSERIRLAKSLLRDSRESINAISERCGFLSPSYFISVFKTQTGITPGQYRKQNN